MLRAFTACFRACWGRAKKIAAKLIAGPVRKSLHTAVLQVDVGQLNVHLGKYPVLVTVNNPSQGHTSDTGIQEVGHAPFALAGHTHLLNAVILMAPVVKIFTSVYL